MSLAKDRALLLIKYLSEFTDTIDLDLEDPRTPNFITHETMSLNKIINYLNNDNLWKTSYNLHYLALLLNRLEEKAKYYAEIEMKKNMVSDYLEAQLRIF